jgi:hypothetical protein
MTSSLSAYVTAPYTITPSTDSTHMLPRQWPHWHSLLTCHAHAQLSTVAPHSKVAPFTGATIRLERGSVWVDDLLSVPGLVGGALADFGNDSLPRPAIWHSRSAVIDPHGELAAASVCVRLGNPRDVVVSNLHLAGCYVGVSLEFDPTAATPASNVTLTNCSFADIRTPYGAVQPSLGKSTSLITFTCGG